MLSVEEAYGRIMSFFGPLEPEEKPILECLGQVLAADISSPLDLPPLANSGIAGAGGTLRFCGQNSDKVQH